MKILFIKDKIGYAGVPIGDYLSVCGQGLTIDELKEDLKRQCIEVLNLLIIELESKEPFLMEECNDDKWINHKAIEAEKTILLHERLYNYKRQK